MPSKIDFVSDIVCPWCFIGLARLEEAIAQESASGASPRAIAFHPFQLDPSTPVEGVDLRERLAQKYGLDPDTMFGRVESIARESGIPLDFAKVRRTFNTLKAHVLISLGRGETQLALGKALFAAYFLEGRDIGDDATLVEIGEKHGLDPQRVLAALHDEGAAAAVRGETRELAQRGITGVPFVIFDGKVAVSGAQTVSVFRQALDRTKG